MSILALIPCWKPTWLITRPAAGAARAARLKLVKTVTNNNGGTAVATDFTLSAAGPTPVSGAGGVDSDVNAGTYTLLETNVADYTAGSWSCSGGSFTAPDKITLALGQS